MFVVYDIITVLSRSHFETFETLSKNDWLGEAHVSRAESWNGRTVKCLVRFFEDSRSPTSFMRRLR